MDTGQWTTGPRDAMDSFNSTRCSLAASIQSRCRHQTHLSVSCSDPPALPPRPYRSPYSAKMNTLNLLLLLLTSLLSIVSAGPTNVTFLLNDCCGPIQSYFLRTLTLPDPALNVSLNVNLSTADAQSTVVYTQRWNDPGDDNVDMLTADPTAANPAFLTAHGDYQFIQYVQSPLNATTPSARRPNPAPHLSNMMPYPQADVPGVGLYYVELHYLFYLDLLSSYYSIAYIDVDGPAKTSFDLMIFASPDVFSGGVTATRPAYADTRRVPADSYPGVWGSKVAVNQQLAQVYINILFWQASEPEYQKGWLWVYDARKNAVVSEVSYPVNTTGYFDFKTELVWSAKRNTLYGATFPQTDAMHLDSIDPTDGTVVRIADFDSGMVMDNYDACHSLDDETGWWWFATNDYYEAPAYGLVWLLYAVNVETGVKSASHMLNMPYFMLGFSFIPPPSHASVVAMTQALTSEQGQADEMETAALRQRAKRVQGERRSRKVSRPTVAQQ